MMKNYFIVVKSAAPIMIDFTVYHGEINFPNQISGNLYKLQI